MSGRKFASIEDRFYEKFIADPNSGCWLWTAGTTNEGYGLMRVRGKHTLAHRISWELRNGVIPAGLLVLHKCDTPSCCNPDHLYVGTPKENSQDAVRRKRFNPRRGEASPLAVLTESIVRDIRSTVGTCTAVGAAFGIDPSYAWRIRTGRLWAHSYEGQKQ